MLNSTLISIRRSQRWLDAMIHFVIHRPLLKLSTMGKSELLFFLEEHTETDNCAIDQEAADNTHNHSWDRNDVRMC
jgi:hypothetical protein